MATLTKRKKRPLAKDDSATVETRHVQDIFRRAFEATFNPLATEPKPHATQHANTNCDDAQDASSECSGIPPSPTNEPVVQVIHCAPSPPPSTTHLSRPEHRAFMSSNPPPTSSTSPSIRSPARHTNSAEHSLVQNDLALQQLLRDSHMLSAAPRASSAPDSLAATGLQRHRSTDLALLALGAKRSVYTQAKMPMAQRKHEEKKRRDAEEKRRADAREGGVVLERVGKGGKGRGADQRRRGRGGGGIGGGIGVGGPGVGRFTGGTLRLTKGDVRSITGGGERGSGSGRRGRGRGRGRGRATR